MSSGFTHESQDAVSVEWYTPPWVFEKLGIEFDMDVCTVKGGMPHIPAKNVLSKEDNGLTTKWEGSVWCNPPYGKETSAWLDKFAKHGNGISLVFARTDTKWFHDIISKVDAVLFVKGRIQFIDGNGATNKSGSTCGSMLLAFGKDNVESLKNIEGFLVINNKGNI